jgi:hypothetical protein
VYENTFGQSCNYSFLHQLANELADYAFADYIAHSIHTYNIINIRAFLLLIDKPMCGRVTFCLAEWDFLRSNFAAIRALGLNSLLSFSFTLHYLTLGNKPLVVIASMRT